MYKEGRKIKNLPPMIFMTPYVMPNRNGASNHFSASVDITEAEKFLRTKRAEGKKGMGMMDVFIAAYIRTIAEFPGVNRFIRGQKIYARNGIDICLTIKKKLELSADETIVKLPAEPTDTLSDVYERLKSLIEENRLEGDQNGMDNTARVLSHMPGVLLKFIVWFLKTLDYFGILPKQLVKLSPFHGTMFLTNIGSLGISPIYHHLYDFGNLPVFCSIGAKKCEYKANSNGETVMRKMLEFKVVCDERICDGHYYSRVFKALKNYLENPWLLESPPQKVERDLD